MKLLIKKRRRFTSKERELLEKSIQDLIREYNIVTSNEKQINRICKMESFNQSIRIIEIKHNNAY